MLWIKIVLACAAIAFCTLLGHFAASKYRSRRAFYGQMHTFNERYLAELGYSRKPLPQFLAEYRYTGEFARTVETLAVRREGAAPLSFLSAEENKAVQEYFQMLGRGDAHSQSGYFSARRAPLAQKKEESEKEAKERGALYLKLGLLGGLAFVILIV